MTGGKGLEEVVAAQTAISDIDGKLGKLWYVGYSIDDLAENSTFEEVVFLLQNLSLPDQPQLDELTELMVGDRETADFVSGLMPTLAEQTSPMSMLRTSVSAASAYDPDGWDQSTEANYRKAIRLVAVMPTLIAYYDRHRRDLPIVEPNPKLPHAANFLYMLSGEEPDHRASEIFDILFILYADHTMNASTFTARVVASTLSDMHSAVTAAIAALKGPLHGGANELAMRMIQEIGEVERAESFVRDLFERKEKIMGFGHRVYRNVDDPRATILRALSKELGEAAGTPAGSTYPSASSSSCWRTRACGRTWTSTPGASSTTWGFRSICSHRCSPLPVRPAGPRTSESSMRTTGSSGRTPSTSARATGSGLRSRIVLRTGRRPCHEGLRDHDEGRRHRPRRGHAGGSSQEDVEAADGLPPGDGRRGAGGHRDGARRS